MVGRLYRGICKGWIVEPRPVARGSKGEVAGSVLGSQQPHAALQAGGRVESFQMEKDLGVLVKNS